MDLRIVAVLAERSRIDTALAATGVEVRLRTADPAVAVATAAEHAPDLLLVDIASDMPIADVEELAAVAPVLALADTAEPSRALDAVRAGVLGYLVGPVGMTRLAAAMHRVAAGEAVYSDGLAALVLDEHAGPDDVPAATRPTERETQVLWLIAEGLTARQVAARLALSPRTVENHLHNLMRKLEAPNRALLVRAAIARGFV